MCPLNKHWIIHLESVQVVDHRVSWFPSSYLWEDKPSPPGRIFTCLVFFETAKQYLFDGNSSCLFVCAWFCDKKKKQSSVICFSWFFIFNFPILLRTRIILIIFRIKPVVRCRLFQQDHLYDDIALINLLLHSSLLPISMCPSGHWRSWKITVRNFPDTVEPEWITYQMAIQIFEAARIFFTKPDRFYVLALHMYMFCHIPAILFPIYFFFKSHLQKKVVQDIKYLDKKLTSCFITSF